MWRLRGRVYVCVFTEMNSCMFSFTEVELEYSVDHGASWRTVKESCLPSQPECTEYWPSIALVSDMHVGSVRVTVPAPRKVR